MRVSKVLVVEDNPMDVRMLQWAFAETGCGVELIVVDDGETALSFLRGEAPYEGAAIPDLVILDLNLKRVDGPEVLNFIRRTERLRDLAVVILSSSPEDLMRSEAGTANGYFQKPAGLDEYVAVGKDICSRFIDGAGFEVAGERAN